MYYWLGFFLCVAVFLYGARGAGRALVRVLKTRRFQCKTCNEVFPPMDSATFPDPMRHHIADTGHKEYRMI